MATDETGAVRFASGSSRLLFGLPLGDLRGRPIDQIWSGRAPLLRRIHAAMRGTPSCDTVMVGDTWFELRFDPLYGDPATAAGCLMVALRASSSTGIAGLLRRDERRLRLLFRQMPGAIWATDKGLRIVYAVGRLKTTLLSRRAAAIGLTIPDIVRQADADPELVVHHAAALTGTTSNFRYEFRGRTYDMSLEPLRDGLGTIVGCIGVGLDITDQSQVEKKLRQSEARVAAAQRAAHIGSWTWEVDTDAVTWSDELFRIYGLAQEVFPANFRAFLAHVHPEDADATKRVIFDSLREGKPFVYDHRIIRPDGSVRMLHTRGDVVRDERGKIVGMCGSCWDVTDRWQADQELGRAVSLLKATLDSTADGILVVDREGRLSAFNQRFLTLWRLPGELAVRRDDEALLRLATDQLSNPDGFRQRVEDLYHQPEAESLDVLRFKDGRIFERYSQPQRIGGEVVGRVWSFRDVTERERLFRSVTLLADASRLLASLEIEKALEAMARLTIPALGDGCAIDLFIDHGGPRRLIAMSRDPSRSVTAELPRAVLTGHSLIFSEAGCSYLAVPLMVRGETVGTMLFLAAPHAQYTEPDLRLAEELAHRAELAIANARLYQDARDALKARDEFLSIAAHELRGPVAALRLAVQGIQRVEPSSPTVPRALEVIAREERRIARFVDDLLDVSRVRSGQLHFEFEEVDLAEVTRDVVARLAPELTRSGSSLRVTADASVKGTWDRTRVDQIVWNLASNAMKYGRGKPIEIAVTGSGQSAWLVVRDHGIGIPPDQQERIFEPFERGASGRHYGGLGLGLYIVRSIVDGLGGSLRLESQPGAGSTFTVELPRKRAS